MGIITALTIKANSIEEATSGGATYFLTKAWVNFNSLTTLSITDSGNVSSVTDNGTGNFTTNFSNTLSTAGYAPNGFGIAYSFSNVTGASMITLNSTGANTRVAVLKSTSAMNTIHGNTSNGQPQDAGNYSISVVN